MQIEIISIAVALLLLLILMSVSIYLLFLSVSWLYGAPYVPIKSKELTQILETVKMPSRGLIIDLGCGDGRVLKQAVEMYGVRGIGYDVNPFVLAFARLRSRTRQDITYYRKDIRNADLFQADVIFLFLFPKIIGELKTKFLHETKHDVIFISHAFKIPYLDDFTETVFEGKTFKTYIYNRRKIG